MRTGVPRRLLGLATALAVGAGCATGEPASPPSEGVEVEGAPGPEQGEPSAAAPTVAPSLKSPSASPATSAPRPSWLGTRVLPDRGDGFGEVRDTPPELVDRQLPPPPPQDEVVPTTFDVEVGPVPDDVLARSTWSSACPVARDELAYVTLTYHGFDGRPHRGELLVHADVTDDVVAAFRAAYAARFPIEEMRVVAADELDLPPTGDGNNTTAFVCRPIVGRSSWSAHAYGRAVDVNPFHNPYRREDGLVLPELASAYVDREVRRPGMLYADSALVRELVERGWDWGGDWTEPVDWMHLSETGG